MGGAGVVVEYRPGLVGGGHGEKALHPVQLFVEFVSGGSVAASHHQHVPKGGLPNPRMSVRGYIFRKILADGGIQGDAARLIEFQYGQRRQAFADGEHAVQLAFMTGGVVGFQLRLSAPQNVQAVHGDMCLLQALQQGKKSFWGNTFPI